jgi:uncharacterized protein (TIGR02145 family)
MQTHNCKWYLFFVVFGISTLFVTQCTKDDNQPSNPTNGKTTATFNPYLHYGRMVDQDGNSYKTIVIGTQTWMAENLRTTKYRNGDSIPEIADSIVWGNSVSGAHCNYRNYNSVEMIATYGRLYNWYAVDDSRNIAPEGWHVPTNEEWTTLINYLGGDSLSIEKLKEYGDKHWCLSNEKSNNLSGFTALPGGWRWNYFMSNTYAGYWWSSTEDESKTCAWYRSLTVQPGEPVKPYILSKECGFSVRCVKD